MSDGPKRRAQTQTDRDLAGLRAMRERERSRDRGQRAERAELAEAVPEPFAHIDTGVTARIRADEDLSILYARSEHDRARIEALKKEAADRDLEIAGERPPAIRFDKIERGVKRLHVIATLIVIPVLSGIIFAGKMLIIYTRADERSRIEHEAERTQLIEHERRLHELELALMPLRFMKPPEPDPKVKP